MSTYAGLPCCACQAEWLPVFEAELQRRGILSGPLRIYQLIGGAPQSGGTHVTGGAADFIDLPGADDVWVARQMGADATWLRPYNWDGNGGMAHIHSVLRGCPHNGPAAYQIAAVDDGYNGLGSGGRGASDTGPRPLSGRTWREGIAWAKQQQEEDMAQYAEQIDAIEKGVNQLLARDERFRQFAAQRQQRLLERLDELAAAVKDDATKEQVRKLRADVAADQEPAES